VQPTSGSRRVFEAFLASESFFRQRGESTLRPLAANANRWLASPKINVIKAKVKSLLATVSLSDIIALWTADIVKLLKPFLKSLSEPISLGEISKPYLILWALKFQKAMDQECELP
jgi:hypothetical protein